MDLPQIRHARVGDAQVAYQVMGEGPDLLDAGPGGILFASSHPDRTSALVLANTSARYVQQDDYLEGLTPSAADAILTSVEEMWGTEELAQLAVPSRRDDKAFVRWYAKFQRSSTKPRDAAAWLRGVLDLDVRAALASIRVATLVLHTTGYALIPVEQGRFLARMIEGARLVELEGGDGVLWIEHRDRVVAEVERLVTGAKGGAAFDRQLATVLLTDIVGSTERVAQLGDRRWTGLLRTHDATVRDLVGTFQGRFIKSTGDGLIATFDAPSRALRCAGGNHRFKGVPDEWDVYAATI